MLILEGPVPGDKQQNGPCRASLCYNPGHYLNAAAVHDGDGSLKGLHRKRHILLDTGFEEKFYFTSGDNGWALWETRFGKIGLPIGWDQWYLEATRLMASCGAQVLVYPTAIGWLLEERPSPQCLTGLGGREKRCAYKDENM